MNMKVPAQPHPAASRPCFLRETDAISKVLKQLQPWEFEEWMQTNEKLAVQAFMDARDFQADAAGTPALLTYDGLVYKYIDGARFSKTELAYAQEHIRILSALYGVLRPMDGILPYRLEMKCRLPIEGRSLYQFWHSRLYEHLYRRDTVIVNLASEEYAKAVRKYLGPGERFIDVRFLVWKRGKLRTIVAWAKMARGSMARQIVQNRWDKPEDLKQFGEEGFRFEESLSSEQKYVFVKD